MAGQEGEMRGNDSRGEEGRNKERNRESKKKKKILGGEGEREEAEG